jgi:DNA-binding NtrC family response regulator
MREHYSPCVSSTEPAILPFTDLNRLQQIAVEQALRATKGHKGQATQLLGVHSNTLTRLISQMADA